jgi:small subunit ribosomal protein S20
MAVVHRSAIKRAVQNVRRRLANRSVLSEVKSASRRVYETLAGGDIEGARARYRQYVSVLDGAVRKGLLPANRAANKKSGLAVRINRAQASPGTPPASL